MGTNYYHDREPLNPHRCSGCGGVLYCGTCEPEPRVHIGKSSAGWTFSFHATDSIRSYADWIAALEEGGRIVDEYGEEFSLAEFRAMVERKRDARENHAKRALAGEWGRIARNTNFLDPEGHSFSEGEFS